MKKTFLSILLALSLLAGCSTPSVDPDMNTEDKDQQATAIQIMASFYPLAHFVEQVGGSDVQVTNMTPVGGEPHDYEPTPRELAALQEADLFLFMGANLEPWAEDVEEIFADLNTLEMTEKITLKAYTESDDDHEEEDHDEDDHEEELHDEENHDNEDGDHHDHGEFDPHIWLDPVLVQEQILVIQDALQSIDPQNAPAYAERSEKYLQELQALDNDFQQAFENCSLQDALVSHDAFGYLGDRYTITFHAIAGLSPQSEPSAKHLAEITDVAKEKGIQHVFFETLVSPKLADTIANEVGATTLVLNPLEGLTAKELSEGKTYISVMRENMNNLKTALQCQ